jgi:hypothetical protein
LLYTVTTTLPEDAMPDDDASEPTIHLDLDITDTTPGERFGEATA